jgi:DNA polymerase-3 subunit chi
MTEILFYHLDRQPVEKVLPDLLERCLERGWRTVVQVGSEERRDALDAHLWTYRDEAFLPHGTRKDGNAGDQPVWLTAEDDNPNQATVRFLTDGVDLADPAGYRRVVLMFDGNDPDAVDRARAMWTRVRAEGHEATYWRQAETGRWEKKG